MLSRERLHFVTERTRHADRCLRLAPGRLWVGICLGVLAAGMGLAGNTPYKTLDQYVHTSWTSEEGLPQNSVEAIEQTPDGYLWMGTEEGLVRFDGVHFTVFSKANTAAFQHNDVRALRQTRGGVLWAGTSGGGALAYTNGQFRNYGIREGLSNNFVNAIAEDPTGVVWLGTDDGLTAFASGKLVRVDKAAGLPSGTITALAVGPRGGLWVGTDKGLSRAEPNSFRRTGDTAWVNVTHPLRELESKPITALYTAPDGSLWAGTADARLFHVTLSGVIAYGWEQGLPRAPILSVLEDARRALWVGTGAGGVCLLHLDSEHSFACDASSTNSSGNTVLSLFEDREENIWMGTEAGGLHRFRNGSLTNYGPAQGITGVVRSIFEDFDHSLWIATDLGLRRFRNGAVTVYRSPYGSASNYAWCVMKDRDGNLWVGTKQGGLNEFTRNGVKNYSTRDGLPDSQIHAVYQDHLGPIWIGTERGGATVLDGRKFHTYTRKDGLADNRVWNILEDHAGDLWFGSDSGVSRLHNGHFTAIKTANPNDPDPLVGSVVYIYEDREHVLWFGTYGAGLKRLENGRMVTYKKSNGLYDDTVWNVLEDRHKRLWMSSNFGIFRADKQELNDYAAGKIARVHSVSYGTADGLTVPECNGGGQNTGWRAEDGRLLFSCVHGVVAVNPDDLRDNGLAPPVVIEQAVINGTQQAGGASLPVGKGELEFHMAALSFVAPEKIAFRYELEGFDNNWIDAGNRRDVYYTNIPAGRYRFQVVAANSDGVWNNTGASFSFVLKPRFYKTGWFYFLCGIVVMTLVGLCYVWRVGHLRRREDELERLVAERTAELESEILQHRETEQELQQEIVERKRATEHAEAATRAKSEFLANMSHEIRTPLNGVMGTLELIEGTGLSPDQRELLGIAQHSAGALLAVIDDILDFSKIEAGKLHFEREPFDLTDTVVKACRAIGVKAHAKGLELACSIAPDVPAQLTGDAARLRQVLLNLLGNALKFTESGEVVLQVRLRSADSEQIELEFSVSDTGIGIPKEKQDSIFQAFSQADTSITRRFGGTGLGLTICSRIVHLMGGRIWLESEADKGSTFYFTAKFDAARAVQTCIRPEPRLKGARILIVEDNPAAREILRRTIDELGAAPDAVASADEAIGRLRDVARGNRPFQILLIDCRLAETSGTEVHELLKAEQTRIGYPAIPTVLMLECDRYSVVASQWREIGLASYILKPFSRQELLEAFHGALAPQGEQPPIQLMARGHSDAPLNVLLAEDNTINQRVAVNMLQSMGHAATIARNGKEAVELVKQGGFDLILMDMHMPEMDGLAATAAIREWQKARGEHVPIVAITASAMRGDRERCLAAEMDGYISKPFSKTSLETVIQQAIRPAAALEPA